MKGLTGKSLLSFILVMALLVLFNEAHGRGGGGGGGRGGGGGNYQASRPGTGGGQYNSMYQRNVNVNVDNDWHGGRYGYGGVAAGVAGAVAVGTVVGAISRAARPVVYGGTTYYVDGNTYYKPCYQGDEAAYCVVQNPNP